MPSASPLLDWYDRQARPLPWRTQPSLYRTVVSEFMCQQTQIATVLPYFARWMAALPDFAALAAAEEAQVLKLWEGLGYYSRARNLQRLAQSWVDLAARGQTPQTAAAWRELPGVGPYTAAAIASIAFGEAVAVVDGNVVRVLARLHAVETEFRDLAAAQRDLSPHAAARLDRARPGDHNQAMMELGARVCTKGKPSCLLCPLRPECRAAALGRADELPRLTRRAAVAVRVDRLWVLHQGALLLQRTPGQARRLAGMYELPACGGSLPTPPGEAWAVRRRAITHHRITEHIHRLPCTPDLLAAVAAREDLRWATPAELEALTLSGPHRRWVRELARE